MKLKNLSCKCGSRDFAGKANQDQMGIYCRECAGWIKWADTNQRRMLETEGVRVTDLEFTHTKLGEIETKLVEVEVKIDKLAIEVRGLAFKATQLLRRIANEPT